MTGIYQENPRTRERAKPPDFSARAIRRAVLARSAQRPYVLYPLAIGLLGGMAAAVLGPSALFILPAVAGLAIGLGGWTLDNTLRRDKFAGDYLQQLHQTLAGQMDRSIAVLGRDLTEVGSTLGLNQLDRLQGKYRTFKELLQRKLDPHELTFSRYLGMTEQVFLAGLDNLIRVADTRKGMSAIDQEHVAGRIQQLQGMTRPNALTERELEALEQRQALYHRQAQRIQDWLSQNEAAMTRMDQVMASIAEMDTSKPHASMDMESAMQELERLAGRASRYARGRVSEDH